MTVKTKIVASGIIAICVLLLLGALWLGNRGRPCNILLVTLDTTRADRLGCYGYSAACTPVLDRLAREGTLFERAFCCVPLTLPSHATIMTGLYPPEHGLHVNAVSRLSPEVPTLAQAFGSNGFATAAFLASTVLGSAFGLDHGFQKYDDNFYDGSSVGRGKYMYRPASSVADLAISWLQTNSKKPFFCWVHMYDPHFPYESHEDVFGGVFTNRPYDAEIAFVDIQIGRILRQLETDGRRSRTLVVITADHGESMPDDHLEPEPHHGLQVYNATMHVPLIVSMPSAVPAGDRVSVPVSQVDLFETILSLAGLPHQRRPGSEKRRSLFDARPGASKAPCYGEADLPFTACGWSPLRTLVTEKWKYIQTAKVELYNLASDPRELTNVAERLSGTVRQLDAELRRLEGAMSREVAAPVHVNSADQRRFESLGGYVSGGGEAAPSAAMFEKLKDIKDMLPVFADSVTAFGLVEAGRLDEGIALARETVRASPETLYFRAKLGCALIEANRMEEAVTVHKALVAEYDDRERDSAGGIPRLKESAIYPAVINNCSYALCRLGRFDEALPLAETATGLEPSNPCFVHTLALACAGLGQSERALEYAKTALSMDPESPEYLLLVAELQMKRGEHVEAIQGARLAFGFSKKDKDRREALELLRKLNRGN